MTFSYPGTERVALHDVCLRIEPGEVVALVGANGSGKTTLAKLLAGLYLPGQGRVCWDGRDTREVDRRELLGHTAIVFQDFIQYALSAGDNIALGRHERASDTAGIVRAAEQANYQRVREANKRKRDRSWDSDDYREFHTVAAFRSPADPAKR